MSQLDSYAEKNTDGTNWQHFTEANTRMPIYTRGSSYIVQKNDLKKKSATFLMLNSAKYTVHLFLSELHRKNWICRNLEII